MHEKYYIEYTWPENEPKYLQYILSILGIAEGDSTTLSWHGGASDGDKFLCLDSLFHDITDENCLVYSFGISDDWSFELSIAELGCKVSKMEHEILYKNGFFRKITNTIPNSQSSFHFVF